MLIASLIYSVFFFLGDYQIACIVTFLILFFQKNENTWLSTNGNINIDYIS